MNPSDEQKRQILHPHVFYTIQQLASLMTIRHPPPFRTALANARVESIATNSRNLLLFFETAEDKRQQDDVLAADFGFEVHEIAIQSKLRSRVNKEVAHLTYSRIEHYQENRRDWQYRKFVPQILDRCADFIAHLLQTQQLPQDAIRQWRRLMADAEKVANDLRNPNASATMLNISSTASTAVSTTIPVS